MTETLGRCKFLRNSALDCIRCDAKRSECPKKINKCIIGQKCWAMKIADVPEVPA